MDFEDVTSHIDTTIYNVGKKRAVAISDTTILYSSSRWDSLHAFMTMTLFSSRPKSSVSLPPLCVIPRISQVGEHLRRTDDVRWVGLGVASALMSQLMSMKIKVPFFDFNAACRLC